MLTFVDHILYERFVNAIGDRDQDIKEKYKDQVWNILRSSYKSIGGIKGSGFNSKEDMVENIPMWKMLVKDGEVKVVVMYKDKGGRKSVAVGTDGSLFAKKNISKIFAAELERSFGEKSKGSLGAMMKSVPWDVLEPFLVEPSKVGGTLRKNVTPLTQYQGKIPDDAKQTIAKYPQLKKYGYIREIDGHPTFKVMVGTPGKTVKRI